MPFLFSNAQETSERYGNYIAEFQDLFTKHEVSFGSPQDFFRLAPKLAYDESFRADFSGLTKLVGEKEQGRLTLTRILTIIAIAMGGEGIEDLGSANAVPISLTVVFLAGVGGWSEDEPSKDTVEVGQGTTRASSGDGFGGGNARNGAGVVKDPRDRDEMEARELEHRLSTSANELEGLTASLFSGPALVKEALSRLEINTRELKIHLDSIDSRIERIEPHLDDLSARITSPVKNAAPVRAETNGKPKTSMPTQRYSQWEMPVPIAQASVVALERTSAVPETRLAAPRPVEDSPVPSEVPQHRLLYGLRLRTMVGVLLLLIAAVTGVWFYISRGRELRAEEEKRFASVTRTGTEAGTAAGGYRAAALPITDRHDPPGAIRGKEPPPQVSQVQPAAAPRVPAKVEPSVQERTDNPPVVPIAVPGKIQIVKQKEEGPPVMPGGLQMSGNIPGAVAAGAGSRPVTLAAAAAPAAIPSAGRGTSSTTAPSSSGIALVPSSPAARAEGSHVPLFVPAEGLVKNVIASPKPTYPPGARFQRLEGNVILQAEISENGSIKSVSVVSGPLGLREAAIDALKHWKYKPYLVNGKPEEVRTYVNFHFTMDRP